MIKSLTDRWSETRLRTFTPQSSVVTWLKEEQQWPLFKWVKKRPTVSIFESTYREYCSLFDILIFIFMESSSATPVASNRAHSGLGRINKLCNLWAKYLPAVPPSMKKNCILFWMVLKTLTDIWSETRLRTDTFYHSVKCFNPTQWSTTLASFQPDQKEAYCHHFWEYI